MSTIPVILADEDTEAILASWRISNPAMRERLLIFGAIGVVTLLVLGWAVFLRKRRRHRREHHQSYHHSSRPAEPAASPAPGNNAAPPERRHRRRRSRHRHRQRNPTLAETGGLPPIRTEGPPEPQA
jgi:type VI protein secretion system component VasK